MATLSFISGLFLTICFLIVVGILGETYKAQSKQIREVIDLLEKIYKVLSEGKNE